LEFYGFFPIHAVFLAWCGVAFSLGKSHLAVVISINGDWNKAIALLGLDSQAKTGT
jgi:hypothetical protein